MPRFVAGIAALLAFAVWLTALSAARRLSPLAPREGKFSVFVMVWLAGAAMVAALWFALR